MLVKGTFLNSGDIVRILEYTNTKIPREHLPCEMGLLSTKLQATGLTPLPPPPQNQKHFSTRILGSFRGGMLSQVLVFTPTNAQKHLEV